MSIGTPSTDADTLSFHIRGMDCAEEVAILKTAVGPVVGGPDRLSFDILNGRMTATPLSLEVSALAIMDAVRGTGMRAEPWRDDGVERVEPSARMRDGRVALTAASGLLVLSGFAIHAIFAGGVRAAIGSEGLGLTHDVPMLARLAHPAGAALASRVRIIRQNIVLSLTVKALFVVFTFMGLASLWGAIAADTECR